jgi:hypothetical protein
MPGYQACDVGDRVVRGLDFQARAIGARVVGRQGMEASLVALEIWKAGIEASLSWR